MELEGDEKGVRSCSFVSKKKKPARSETGEEGKEAAKTMKEALRQLDEYFKGQRQRFKVRLNLQGTEFQRTVWRSLQAIPYGQTRSYKEIAKVSGRPLAFRAAGGANHSNPVAIIIPCHRVIGADGSLTGFGAGLWRKKWLIEHEKRALSVSPRYDNKNNE